MARKRYSDEDALTRIPQVTCRFNAYEGGKCVIFEHVNGLKAADYGSPRGCERNV